MFKRVKQNSLVTDVIAQIEEAIFERRFRPGEKLPSPQELQETLGVSRGTLREALRVLEQRGLLEIRPGVGGGAVVKRVTHEQMSEGLALLVRYRRVSIEHMAEFREGIEGLVAALAARRARPDDLVRLEEILAEARELLVHGSARLNEFLATDMKFHMHLAAMTGNPLYESVLRSVQENIQSYYNRYYPTENAYLIQENYDDLAALAEHIRHGRPEEAAALAQEHIHRFTAYMRSRREGPRDDSDEL